MNDDSLCVVLTTVGDRETAQSLAHQLIQKSLAACVQIDGPIVSVYRWEGRVCQDAEYRLMIKSVTNRWPELSEFFALNHPYDTPQLVRLAVDEASEGYRSWVRSSVTV